MVLVINTRSVELYVPHLRVKVLGKPVTNRCNDAVHAYAWKPSCPLVVLEISHVSECKTSITLLLFSISYAVATAL